MEETEPRAPLPPAEETEPFPVSPPTLAYASVPSARPWRGLAVAATLHAGLFAALFLLLRERHLQPPPDRPVISLVMEAAPAPSLPPQPQPSQPAAAPPPSPAVAQPQPTPSLPMPPPPPAPVISAAADLPTPPPTPPVATEAIVLPMPPPAPPTHVATPPRRVTVQRHITPAPASPASTANIQTIPAKPDAASNNPPPDYPESAREEGEQGQVLLSIRVTPDGAPSSVTITRSTGYTLLDQAARDAVLQWHFLSATKAGQPVPSTLPFWITFRLQQ